MRRQNDLLDAHGSVALLPLGEHVIGATLADSLEVATRLLHPGTGTPADGVAHEASRPWCWPPTPRFRGAGPSALYAQMLRRYLQQIPD